MTANGFIRRGPMAADVFEQQFTRIHNAVFRDRRMSYKAKGIFGLISTHRDGFGLSIESLVSFSTDGVSAVRTGLSELEACGYLVREQQTLDGPTKERPKAKKGSFGAMEYFITDMPDGLVITVPAPASGTESAPGENPRSDPSCENRTTEENPRSAPSCDFPHTEEPHAEDQRRKKNNPQKNNSLSDPPSSPEPQPTAGPETDERESGAARKTTTAAPAAAAASVPVPEPRQEIDALEPLVGTVIEAYIKALNGVYPMKSVVQRLRGEARELLGLNWPVEHVALLAGQLPALNYSSLTRHAEHNPPPAPKAAAGGAVPWCGNCESAAYRWVTPREGSPRKCRECNPSVALATA
ncbi:hypothetical protein [Streptomyces goshikiensis]|uniref:hypothetical protein n=1 Tax=Streptomyces goshikiensis TaxID=1942 RepID=UPI0037AE0B7E